MFDRKFEGEYYNHLKEKNHKLFLKQNTLVILEYREELLRDHDV